MQLRNGVVWSILCGVVFGLATDPARGVTVTLTYEDSCTAMGALSNDDGDAFSVLQMSQGGVPSKPYISTPFPGGDRYAHYRRAIAEFSLTPMRQVSGEPNAVASAALRFYFDDVIFPGSSPNPWTTQDFTVELYVDTADGAVSGTDPNDLDPAAVGQDDDDWAGPAIADWHFQAGDAAALVAGQPIVGIYGPDEPFPARFGDAELQVYGMIGFEVDVTGVLGQAIGDPNVRYLGFRWISNMADGYWTSMDPAGHLPSLVVEMTADEPLRFVLTSSDTGPVTGDQHRGRPYHVFNDANDEAIYLTAPDAGGGGHSPDAQVTWPRADGVIDWEVFTDPNRASERPEAVVYDSTGGLRYVYQDVQTQEYVLIADENEVPAGSEKVYYQEWSSDRPLSFGNWGPAAGSNIDRQYALLTEFKLERPGWYGLDPNHLVLAHIELTIDRIVDMSLGGNSMALLPSVLYVNSFTGDGVVGRFENAQEDFGRIDQVNADTALWLTIDGSPKGTPITDFSLSWYKLVDPGLGEPFTVTVDVTGSVRRLLSEQAAFAGFALSASPDGEFALASVDLVDDVRNKTYLPRLILQTTLE